MEIVPIALLSPALHTDRRGIHAVVTLLWPYSQSTQRMALLLAEPDSRLRRQKGQVRVQFFGAPARALAHTHVGIGDVVLLRLHGTKWLQPATGVRTPGRSVETELSFENYVELEVIRNGERIAHLHVNTEGESQATNDPSPTCHSAPEAEQPHFHHYEPNASPVHTPLFHKRVRISSGSMVDSPFDPFTEAGYDIDDRHRKRVRRSWGTGTRWTIAPLTTETRQLSPAERLLDLEPWITDEHEDQRRVGPSKTGGTGTSNSLIIASGLDGSSDLTPSSKIAEQDGQYAMTKNPHVTSIVTAETQIIPASKDSPPITQDKGHVEDDRRWDATPGSRGEEAVDPIKQTGSPGLALDITVHDKEDLPSLSREDDATQRQSAIGDQSRTLEPFQEHANSVIDLTKPSSTHSSVTGRGVVEAPRVATWTSEEQSSFIKARTQDLSSPTGTNMPPPPLPSLQIPQIAASGIGMTAKDGTVIRHESPQTPELQPLLSASLPLPSPFPGDDLTNPYAAQMASNAELNHGLPSESSSPLGLVPDWMFQFGFGVDLDDLEANADLSLNSEYRPNSSMTGHDTGRSVIVSNMNNTGVPTEQHTSETPSAQWLHNHPSLPSPSEAVSHALALPPITLNKQHNSFDHEDLIQAREPSYSLQSDMHETGIGFEMTHRELKQAELILEHPIDSDAQSSDQGSFGRRPLAPVSHNDDIAFGFSASASSLPQNGVAPLLDLLEESSPLDQVNNDPIAMVGVDDAVRQYRGSVSAHVQPYGNGSFPLSSSPSDQVMYGFHRIHESKETESERRSSLNSGDVQEPSLNVREFPSTVEKEGNDPSDSEIASQTEIHTAPGDTGLGPSHQSSLPSAGRAENQIKPSTFPKRTHFATPTVNQSINVNPSEPGPPTSSPTRSARKPQKMTRNSPLAESRSTANEASNQSQGTERFPSQPHQHVSPVPVEALPHTLFEPKLADFDVFNQSDIDGAVPKSSQSKLPTRIFLYDEIDDAINNVTQIGSEVMLQNSPRREVNGADKIPPDSLTNMAYDAFDHSNESQRSSGLDLAMVDQGAVKISGVDVDSAPSEGHMTKSAALSPDPETNQPQHVTHSSESGNAVMIENDQHLDVRSADSALSALQTHDDQTPRCAQMDTDVLEFASHDPTREGDVALEIKKSLKMPGKPQSSDAMLDPGLFLEMGPYNRYIAPEKVIPPSQAIDHATAAVHSSAIDFSQAETLSNMPEDTANKYMHNIVQYSPQSTTVSHANQQAEASLVSPPIDEEADARSHDTAQATDDLPERQPNSVELTTSDESQSREAMLENHGGSTANQESKHSRTSVDLASSFPSRIGSFFNARKSLLTNARLENDQEIGPLADDTEGRPLRHSTLIMSDSAHNTVKSVATKPSQPTGGHMRSRSKPLRKSQPRVSSHEHAVAPQAGEAAFLARVQAHMVQAGKPSSTVSNSGLRTSHGYFIPLAELQLKLNVESQFDGHVDVLAVVSKQSSTPKRADKGPRDFYTHMRLVDESLDFTSPKSETGEVDVSVQILRPWKSALPEAATGDIVLLRNFDVTALNGSPVLRSTDSSAWCVWGVSGNTNLATKADVPAAHTRSHDTESSSESRSAAKSPIGALKLTDEESTLQDFESITGPPIEYGTEERQRAMALAQWWSDIRSTQADNTDNIIPVVENGPSMDKGLVKSREVVSSYNLRKKGNRGS